MGQRSRRGSDGSTAGRGGTVVQRAPGKAPRTQRVQRRASPWPAQQATGEAPAAAGGLPPDIKAGTEALSGVAMDDVRVHESSDKPAELGALAYAQGNDIHLGPGQEEHLPHEAWHVVQQKQGRVEASTQAKGVELNDDAGLEAEADVMGAKAAAVGAGAGAAGAASVAPKANAGATTAGGASDAGAAEAEGGAATAGAASDAAAGAAASDGSAAEPPEREAEGAGPAGEEPVQAKRAPGAVVQRVKKKGVVIDISTLTADQCKEHISRAFRLKANKGAGDDADHEYAADDIANLQARQKALKEAEVLAKHGTLTAALAGQLATLATAADFVSPPPWIGVVTTGSEGSEVKKSTNMAPDAGTIVAAWISFLGPGPYSNKHPRTGVPAGGRLVSADGKRSIRYGDHEQNPAKSKPPDHHYHEETWTWDGVSAVTVDNKVQKVPVT